MTALPNPTNRSRRVEPSTRRVEKVIDKAGLRGLPTLAAIVERVALLRGKAIRLEQVGGEDWGALTALWVEAPDVSRIFVRRTDPAAYQVVCALHEIMHMLLDHAGCLPRVADPKIPVPLGTRRARTAGDAPIPVRQARDEADAEYGARLLAQSLLRTLEDSAENRFG